MSAIRGHLIMTLDGDLIVGVREASLQIQMQTLSAANPDGGPWAFSIPGRQSWGVSFSMLNLMRSPEIVRPDVQRALDLLAHTRQLVPLRLETPYGAEYSGEGRVTQHGFSVNPGDAFGMQYSLEGVGALTLEETEFTCGLETFAGTNQMVENTHYIGTQAGYVHMPYFAGNSIPDLLEILYDGEIVATTGGAVTGHGVISFYYEANVGEPRSCVVRVTPDPSPETIWRYVLRCPSSEETYTGGEI